MQLWWVVCSQDTKLELWIATYSFVVSLVWHESSSVMNKLKEVRNTISGNDFMTIDELEDCLQKQLHKAKSRDNSTDLII